jgi:simple sugar transport system permease protein
MFNNVSNFYRDVIWGGVLILVLVFNYFFSHRADRRAVRGVLGSGSGAQH